MFILDCNTRTNSRWNCNKREIIYIRFDLNKEKDILAFRNPDTDINIFVEVARAANNLRPMSWDKPISRVYAKAGGDYRVTFGKNRDCTRNIVIRRDFDEGGNSYKVVWGRINNVFSCATIGGYIDTSKLYVIYENNEWITEW